MLDQPLLDVYIVRGFEGLVRLLEARTGPTSPQAAAALDGVRGRLASLLDTIEVGPSGEVDKQRLDKWLITGAATFVQFLEDRSYNDELPDRFDLPIRAMIEKLTALQKQISPKGP